MAERRPSGYLKLKNYKPSRFMLPTSHYDKAKADRAVKFIENLCHTKGKWAGKRFWLLPWQEQLIRDIFGIVKPDGYRQFRTAFVEICKKVGKSELAAAVALYLLYADNEPSAEVYGAAADRQLYDVLTKGSSDARQNPLHFIITTAGTDRHSIAYELHTKAVNILEGRRVDPTFYPVVYGLKDDEDWEDEANWYKVNPSLGYTVDIERLRDAYREAKQNPADEVFNDWILKKSDRSVILMIGNNKIPIMSSAENRVLNIDQKDIEQYLSEVKDAVEKDHYRLDRNARRQDNINLFLDYVIDEAKAKKIILSLTAMDFSEILQNEHKGYEHENLYVFGKDVTLLERNGTEEKTVSLYIKFNKLENCFVIVISFHEQKHPLTYYFR